MIPSRLFLLVVAGYCVLRPAPLPAEDVAPPVTMEKHYSADLAILMKNGMAIQSKTFVDGDKMRSDVTMNGMEMALIVRKDTRKIYQVLVAQKMVMEMPYNPDKFPGGTGASFGPEGKFEPVGPDTVDGLACTKYKVVSDKTKQVFYFWLDAARKIPVQMSAANGFLTVKWKNFAAGPQDASLFEVPAGYQVTTMQGMPGMPDGGGGQ